MKVYFMVKFGNIHFFTYQYGVHQAKNAAHNWIGGNPDQYIVTQLTEPGDRIALDYIPIAS